jgi:hypothetical protein
MLTDFTSYMQINGKEIKSKNYFHWYKWNVDIILHKTGFLQATGIYTGKILEFCPHTGNTGNWFY